MEATDRKKWKPGGPTRPAAERFWEKVNKDGPAVTEALGPCWLWEAALAAGGYGMFAADGKHWKAHRWAYVAMIGDPGELQLDHLCRVRQCVRPDHLEPVSQRENLLRGTGWSARSAAATHCPRGHEYNEQNTGWTKGTGYRRCNACAREKMAARKAAMTPDQLDAHRARERDRYAAKKATS